MPESYNNKFFRQKMSGEKYKSIFRLFTPNVLLNFARKNEIPFKVLTVHYR